MRTCLCECAHCSTSPARWPLSCPTTWRLAAPSWLLSPGDARPCVAAGASRLAALCRAGAGCGPVVGWRPPSSTTFLARPGRGNARQARPRQPRGSLKCARAPRGEAAAQELLLLPFVRHLRLPLHSLGGIGGSDLGGGIGSGLGLGNGFPGQQLQRQLPPLEMSPSKACSTTGSNLLRTRRAPPHGCNLRTAASV